MPVDSMQWEIVVIDPSRASSTLRERFGALVDADYLPGKTAMRDALCDRLGLSQLEAEELCDSLEARGILRFVRSPEGVGWHIHDEPAGDADTTDDVF
jgi:hypothetical protein